MNNSLTASTPPPTGEQREKSTRPRPSFIVMKKKEVAKISINRGMETNREK